ncbi:MAG: hypothetical protein EA368_16635 [Leptolyngbya sp. DLM2.Bin27]|nr:MAG: hypothetical protein EA368_16635 [Leptolyngbya sp. DLM2.Bin27]
MSDLEMLCQALTLLSRLPEPEDAGVEIGWEIEHRPTGLWLVADCGPGVPGLRAAHELCQALWALAPADISWEIMADEELWEQTEAGHVAHWRKKWKMNVP